MEKNDVAGWNFSSLPFSFSPSPHRPLESHENQQLPSFLLSFIFLPSFLHRPSFLQSFGPFFHHKTLTAVGRYSSVKEGWKDTRTDERTVAELTKLLEQCVVSFVVVTCFTVSFCSLDMRSLFLIKKAGGA
jgi:hypothetical protein